MSSVGAGQPVSSKDVRVSLPNRESGDGESRSLPIMSAAGVCRVLFFRRYGEDCIGRRAGQGSAINLGGLGCHVEYFGGRSNAGGGIYHVHASPFFFHFLCKQGHATIRSDSRQASCLCISSLVATCINLTCSPPPFVLPCQHHCHNSFSFFSCRIEFNLNVIGEDDSPLPEVRASVPNINDPDMPAMTIRMWFIGLFLCSVGG